MRVGYTEVPWKYVLAFVVGLVGVLYFLIQLLKSLFGGVEEKKQKFNVCELCFDVLGDELEEEREEGEEEKEEEEKGEGWGGVVETRRERERRMRRQRGVVTRGAYVQWLLGEEVISQKISLKEGYLVPVIEQSLTKVKQIHVQDDLKCVIAPCQHAGVAAISLPSSSSSSPSSSSSLPPLSKTKFKPGEDGLFFVPSSSSSSSLRRVLLLPHQTAEMNKQQAEQLLIKRILAGEEKEKKQEKKKRKEEKSKKEEKEGKNDLRKRQTNEKTSPPTEQVVRVFRLPSPPSEMTFLEYKQHKQIHREQQQQHQHSTTFWMAGLLLFAMVGLLFLKLNADTYDIHLEDFTENYAALNLPPFTPFSDVKKAWRVLGKKLHPDKCKEPSCEQEYVRISNAYTQISDYEKGKLKVVGLEEKKGEGGKGGKGGKGRKNRG